MPRNRFVPADTVRLPLSEDDWIEIKAGLTWGEQQRLAGAMIRTVPASGRLQQDPEMGIDWNRYQLLKLESWLVEWSFRDGQDKPVRLTRASIANLDEETGNEINDAIDAYVEEQRAKKGRPTPPPPAQEETSETGSSPSPTTSGSTSSEPLRLRSA